MTKKTKGRVGVGKIELELPKGAVNSGLPREMFGEGSTIIFVKLRKEKEKEAFIKKLKSGAIIKETFDHLLYKVNNKLVDTGLKKVTLELLRFHAALLSIESEPRIEVIGITKEEFKQYLEEPDSVPTRWHGRD